MISVLLTLLKIFGIVLLSLLGILLVLLLILLFVPVRYRIKGYYKDEFICHGKITWLLHLLSVSIDFDKELVSSIKVFGIDISSFLNKKKETASTSDTKDTVATDQESKNVTESMSIPTSANNSIEQPNEGMVYSSNIGTGTEPETDSNPKEKQNIFQKIRTFILNIKNKVLAIYHKIIDIIQNIKTKKESIGRYIRILQKEEVKNAFSICKKRIFKIIKHLLPKKMKIHAHIGMEDPSTTGYILAIYSVLPEKIRRQVILKADFDEVIMEADFNIKGSCNAFNLLLQLLSVITNKNCLSFYKLVKKEIFNERK